jgi:hypothetical protein
MTAKGKVLLLKKTLKSPTTFSVTVSAKAQSGTTTESATVTIIR